jgi:RNA polymerase sigma-70 factor (ECF subfamily)
MDETQLIRGVQEGDRNAFRLLVEKYQSMVVNTCWGIIHNREDAEDVAQDVFVEVFRNAAKFRGDAKISTWLYRIATNRSLNFIRNNKRRRLVQSLEEAFTGGRNRNNEISDSQSDQPDHPVHEAERADLLYKAIDHLPEKQRVAFILNKYEELPYQQIAEIMDVSLASVESLIHRAKLNLQNELLACYKKKCI